MRVGVLSKINISAGSGRRKLARNSLRRWSKNSNVIPCGQLYKNPYESLALGECVTHIEEAMLNLSRPEYSAVRSVFGKVLEARSKQPNADCAVLNYLR